MLNTVIRVWNNRHITSHWNRDLPVIMPDTYDILNSWQWNLQHAPSPGSPERDVPQFSGQWNWCGIPVNSPLGVAAGPLLSGDWLAAYAARGFDILVYKTVRTRERACYDPPNLVPVRVTQLSRPDTTVTVDTEMPGSWAVSFGMPSVSVAEWQQDIKVTRRKLRPGQVLVVSVVGTQASEGGNDSGIEPLAADFAECARLACDAGAQGIEANFSCPNVATDDGQLFQNPRSAAVVAERIRAAIGDIPLVLKIGFTDSAAIAADFIGAVARFINGLAMTNSIAARVKSADGSLLFDGAPRGICGDAIRDASVRQVRMYADIIQSRGVPVQVIGVGGISTLAHVQEYLQAGASSVALATAAMLDANVAMSIRHEQQTPA
jgi:dihydroorotate dehydrogenase (NAD+) catalytic subunit